jgi:hypothetical protein
MSFGTGAVKITPAHDPNDYGCGKRHNLEFINILTPEGKINDNGAPFTGMMRCDVCVCVVVWYYASYCWGGGGGLGVFFFFFFFSI